jgi:hypothetical protein
MIVSAWRMWGLGVAWVFGLSVGLGVLAGGAFGLVVGLTADTEALGSGLSASLLFGVGGAWFGAIYGAVGGIPTGVVATGLFAWVTSHQLRSAQLAPSTVRVQGALIAVLVQSVAGLLLLGIWVGDGSLARDAMLYVLPPILLAGGVAALVGPTIVRTVGGPDALVRRPGAAIRTWPATPID